MPCLDTIVSIDRHAYCYAATEKRDLWIDAIVECNISHLRTLYLILPLSCKTVDDIFMGIQEQCYAENGICIVGWFNRNLLRDLFKKFRTKPIPEHYMKTWNNIGRIVSKCKIGDPVKFMNWIEAEAKLVE
ncbi:uncharacterized protein LOC128250786 isoform X2 [Octopus bimaculoides]|nr:uncharacterized protein LOC128250786 isoform X2 [Octopus bimaculoides]